ncbi:unnamed protein product [Microthlaspi erraticum]|uniref:Protein SirB1 N-terminal domain-containing protein n=1 Tax=Microthlaspi erraticum TaxID=1685480 RepID=A0A6D2KCG8_9BRAS|nr:unnamed protein product [Microthlaspi erraticum]
MGMIAKLQGNVKDSRLNRLDAISKEVEAELVSRDIGRHSVQVLEAVNTVLFDLRGFKRTSIPLDPKYFYLHSVLNCRCGTAFLFSVIYIEVCQRLGQSLFGIVNGRCVDDPRSMASDLTAKSLQDLDIATNRDIIGIALANLIRVHWRLASRSSPGLMLTSPISQLNKIRKYDIPLRPQDLRLAIAAAERLLILEPHNWKLRRDLGMMLYHIKQYGEAIQELSISMAFASDEEEVKVMKLFVEKLHLLRLISTLESPVNGSDRLTVP